MRLLFSFLLFWGITFHVAADEIVINFADPVFARLDTEGKKLLSEYAKVYPRIKDFYGNLRIDVDVIKDDYISEESLQVEREGLERAGLDKARVEAKINQWRSGPVRTERQHVVRHRADGYTRVDSQVNRSEMWVVHVDPSRGEPLQETPDLIPSVDIALFTQTMGYALSHSGDPSQKYFSLNAKRNLKNPNEDIEIPWMYFDSAPFCTNRTPLEEVFQRPPLIRGVPYVVEYVRQKEIEGEPIVEIKTSLVDFPDVFGEVWLNRNSWGVRKTYKRSQVISQGDFFGEIRWSREDCTYGGVVDGVPLLKTYQRSFGTCDKETQEEIIAGKVEYKVTNLIPGPPDLSEFDVAQFLPPGVKIGEDISPAHFTPIRIAAIVVGLILFILGIYMKIRYC